MQHIQTRCKDVTSLVATADLNRISLIGGGSGIKIDKNITATAGQKITLKAPQIIFLSGGGGGGANVNLSKSKLSECEKVNKKASEEHKASTPLT